MHFHFLSGPRRAKKVLFLFLQKLLWHFYTIQIVFLYVFHGIQRTESWCCKAVNRWSYIIIISEKRLFLELRLLAYYYLYYLLLPLSPFLVLSKKFSRQPKKISRFYFFSRCWRDICVAYKSIYDVRLFFKRGNFPKDFAYRQKNVTLFRCTL